MKAIIKCFIATIALFALCKVDYPDAVTAFSVIGSGAAVLTATLVPAEYLFTNNLCMGIDINVWKKYVIERFKKDNAFMFQSKDDSAYVLGGAVVYIPQAGAKPVVVKNRSSYPATAVRRTDTDVNYVLDTYSTDPTHIPWADLQTISYDKLDSVLGDHMATLGETIADDLLVKWSPVAAQMIATTGDAISPFTGQTGNRKGLSEKDLASIMIRMNVENVPKEGRIALLDDQMFAYFYDKLSDKQSNAFNQFANETTGQVGKLHGFKIFTRSSVLAYTSGDAVKAIDSALAATDNLASLFWHPATVCRAIGEIKPFQDKDNPLYYGDIYSNIVRMGGRKERADAKGVYAIKQATSA